MYPQEFIYNKIWWSLQYLLPYQNLHGMTHQVLPLSV
jgi:hypothetical protein